MICPSRKTHALALVTALAVCGYFPTAVTAATASKNDIVRLQNQINSLKRQLQELRAAISVSSSKVTINRKLVVSDDIQASGKVTAIKNIESSSSIKALGHITASGDIKAHGNLKVVLPGALVKGTIPIPGRGAVQLINGRVQ